MLHLQCSWGLIVLPTPAWKHWLVACTYAPPPKSHQPSHGSYVRVWGLEQVYHPSHGSCVRVWGAGAGSLKGSGLCLRAQAGKKGWAGDWLSPGPLPLSTHREPWMQSPHIPQRQGGPQSWHSVKFLPLTRPEPAKQQPVIELVFQPKATGVVVFNTQGYLI